MFKAVETTSNIAHAKPVAETAAAAVHNSLTVVTSLSALGEMEGQWRELESDVQNHTSVFQSFDWVMAWSQTYLKEKPTISLHILAGYDEGKLVFLWPLMRDRQMGLSVLTWLTEPFGQYGDVLCRKGHCPRKWMDSSIAFMKRLRDVNMLRLRHVRADSHVATYGHDFFVDAKASDKAPFLDLKKFATDADYDARYSSVQRKRRKKIRKAIEEIGEVKFQRLPTGSLADIAMQSAIAEKNAWLSERGRMNRVMSCPSHVAFLKNLSRRLSGSVEVIVTELTAGGKPVSWEVGFRHQGTHYGYITSHVNALTDLSPGRLHMDLSQRACLADGMSQFDLMVPNDSHKESWSSGAIDTRDYYLPLSAKGFAVGHIYIRTLRPLVRSLYYKATARKFSLKTLLQKSAKPSKDA
jgi:CelD/BcsL family acetyltransferase involved in cellulose biosynthesis